MKENTNFCLECKTDTINKFDMSQKMGLPLNQRMCIVECVDCSFVKWQGRMTKVETKLS